MLFLLDSGRFDVGVWFFSGYWNLGSIEWKLEFRVIQFLCWVDLRSCVWGFFLVVWGFILGVEVI